MRRIHGGVDNSDDRTGDTGREACVDATWLSCCAGVKKESQTAAAPAFPRGFWPGWKDCRPLTVPGVLSVAEFTP